MSRNLWAALRLWLFTHQARRRAQRHIARLTSADYAYWHGLPDVQPRPLEPDLDTPPFFAKHTAPVVNGVRVLGEKHDA